MEMRKWVLADRQLDTLSSLPNLAPTYWHQAKATEGSTATGSVVHTAIRN